MTTPPCRERHLDFLSPHGFSRMNYYEWGDAANPDVLVCAHGLTRNGRDFDALAQALSGRFRIICPDLPGRGKSDWLRDPNDYIFPTYLGALSALLARADPQSLAWVGTSMGGLLGIVLAAQPATPIRKLVINDVGPVIEAPALARIGEYVGARPVFATFEALETHVRAVSAPFGPLTDTQWHHLSETTARQMADGTWSLRYDPGIAVPFRSAPDQSPVLWALWDAIACPTLLLRGAQSDLLAASTALAMTQRGPKPQLVEFSGIGHAPMLLDAAQIDPVAAFLLG
ncbi:MAG: alpha/beta hydrolase [Betaproteobacteria bacterium]